MFVSRREGGEGRERVGEMEGGGVSVYGWRLAGLSLVDPPRSEDLPQCWGYGKQNRKFISSVAECKWNLN